MANYSVVILGGGIAGGFAAIELAHRGCDVVVLERLATPVRKFGETLPPDAIVNLQKVGYWAQFQQQHHLPCPGIVCSWGRPEPVDNDLVFNPFGLGWQLDRAVFESELLTVAKEAGCVVMLGESAQVVKCIGPGWNVSTPTSTWFANFVVDCTGRHGSIIGKHGGAYNAIDNMVAIAAVAKSSSGRDYDSRTFVESHVDGWSYTAMTSEGERTVAFQTDRDLLPCSLPDKQWFWDKLISGRVVGELLTRHDYQLIHEPQIVAAHSGYFESVAGEDWLAVGDAAMTFDPLAGQGTLKAMQSASLSALAILDGFDYAGHCSRQWQEYCINRQSYYGLETRWAEGPFWSRRQRMVAMSPLCEILST